jgi:acyl-CoA thioester hydrolase
MTQPDLPEPLRGYPVILTLPLQWGDQDAFGHVNNVVYFRWFESARVVYLEQSGLGHMMTGDGIGPILASIRCDYRKQLNYPDRIHIGARVTHLGNSSLKMEHVVYSEALAATTAEGESVIVTFDYRGQKSVRIPDDIRANIQQMEQRELA